jgi:multicomponent Na+:H+ antiporter subunit D
MEFLTDLFSNLNIFSKIFLILFSGLTVIQLYKNTEIQNFVSISIPLLLFIFIYKTDPVGQSFSFRPIFNFFEIKLLFTPISKIFSLMVVCLWFLTNIYSIGYISLTKISQQPFSSLFFLSIIFTLLIGISGNLLTLFLFYECLTFATYFLVSFDQTHEAKIAGKYYLKMLLITSGCFLLPAIVLVYQSGGNIDFHYPISENTSGLSFESPTKVAILLIMFLYGYSKAATFPFHSWLPKAMVAHIPVSALLHAVAVVKSGIICILYTIIYIFGIDFLNELKLNQSSLINIPKYICAFSAIYASYQAIKQNELKKILAYSTISQLGYIAMAIFAFKANIESATILKLVSDAITKINMFFIAGFLYLKYEIKKIDSLNGIWKKEKIISICFLISCMSIIGIPPTIGSISKINAASDAIMHQDYFTISILSLGTVLSSIYLGKILIKMFSGTNQRKDFVITNEKMKNFLIMQSVIFIIATLIVLIFLKVTL